MAAPRDLHGVSQGLWQVCKKFKHFSLGTKPHLLAKPLCPTRIGQQLALGNAHPRFMRGKFVGAQKLHRIGCDNGQAKTCGQRRCKTNMRFIARTTSALQFQIEGTGEALSPVSRQSISLLSAPGQQGLTHITRRASGQRNQATCRIFPRHRCKPFTAQLGTVAPDVFKPGAREQRAQPQITLLIARDQKQAMGLVAIEFVTDPHIGTDDGLHACTAGGLVKLDPAEQVAQIGQRDRGLRIGPGSRYEGIDSDNRVHHRVLGMDPQMDKGGVSHGSCADEAPFYRCRRMRNAPPVVASVADSVAASTILISGQAFQREMQKSRCATDQDSGQGQGIGLALQVNPAALCCGRGVIPSAGYHRPRWRVYTAIGITKMTHAARLLHNRFQTQPRSAHLGFELERIKPWQVGMTERMRANFLPTIDPALQLLRIHQGHLGNALLGVPLIGLAQPVSHHIAGRAEAVALQNWQSIV